MKKPICFFLEERHKVEFFDDVIPVLEKLSLNYKLGVLTNGNADIKKLGIDHMFDFSVSSMDVKSNKPDQGHFIRAKELSQINFHNTLHVGDHPENDVYGARKLGINVMWFNLNNLVWDIDENPPIQFKKWCDFVNLLEEKIMATKDSFDAFLSIIKDKIGEFSEHTDQSHIQVFQDELRAKFDDLAKSQGYVSNEEYEALKILATRLEGENNKVRRVNKKIKTYF